MDNLTFSISSASTTTASDISEGLLLLLLRAAKLFIDQYIFLVHLHGSSTAIIYCLEVSSREWELIKLSEDEEDLINKMYRLVGNRWDLIAGRIPGRIAEEIERFWIITHNESFALKNEQNKSKGQSQKNKRQRNDALGW